eukprot:TRINITY_DN9_c0_g1_i2.p1 TRINITY_DN9_c0_g1~~TRINITY_DN9_c0_g1_i2.p1  ORF type:complete len:1283 (-),score=297.99 TRINITY_DN9_c0_g1_i2:13369-17217(-)
MAKERGPKPEKNSPSQIDAATLNERIQLDGELAIEADSTNLLDADPYSPFAIVGIGASAGGLAAFTQFFSAMSNDSGIAFVLIPHLDPTHESMMVELLSRHTQMPICEAQDAMVIEQDHIYVIPPNKYIAIHERKLQLSARPDGYGAPTAIDFFFASLASEQQSRAIGIILSGTSSHGSIGLKEIKLRGGMMMVQQPDTAEFDQMPANAIATGLIDFVLPPAKMPETLIKYVRHRYVQGAPEQSAEVSAEELNRILMLIRTRTKYDFRSYRKKMLIRRVMRRMGLLQFETIAEYVEHLRNNPDEVSALYKDLLIGVTDFFRDPQAFDALERLVIPELIATQLSSPPTGATRRGMRSPDPKIRVWVPACATGEEAYSIAMLLIERYSTTMPPIEIQVFATDIDDKSLETARLGVYSECSTASISAARLQRFFTKVDSGHWKVTKQLRDTVVFAPQNLISDAPFSRLNLVSCRNLLIYLEPEIQAKVIRLFHFALAEGGFLMLGPSETLGRESELFEPISKAWRLFRRADSKRRIPVDLPIVTSRNDPRLVGASPDPAAPAVPTYRELMQRLLQDEFVPASALINRNHEIVCVMGPLVDYLEFPEGALTHDLLAMVRAGLRAKVRAAIYKAIHTTTTAYDHDARVQRDAKLVACSITVIPVPKSPGTEELLIVAFQDHPLPVIATSEGQDSPPSGEEDSHFLRHMEHELKSAREDLQSTVEEYESSTEELKASNEEVMSMNEELQSSNEELESSKEELQSLNEELHTVNVQLQEKLEELDKSNSDLLNLMASSEVATLFLDTELRIKRFTPSVIKVLNLRITDIDRPISDFAFKFDDDSLLNDCLEVLKMSVPTEKEIWTKPDDPNFAGHATAADEPDTETNTPSSNPPPCICPSRCYFRRILPYRANDNRISGVVVTMLDITHRMISQARSRRLAAAIRDSNDAVLLQDFEGRILTWNRGATKIYGYSEAEALQMNLNVTIPENRIREWQSAIEQLRRGDTVPAFETQRLSKANQLIDIEQTMTAYRDERGRPVGIATTARDISERKRLQKHVLEIAAEEQRRIGQDLHDGTGQELTGLTLFAGTLVDLLDHTVQKAPNNQDWLIKDGELQRLRRTATQLAEGLVESQRHVQQLSHGILPVQVEGEGLRAALEEFVTTMNIQQKISCSFECPVPIRITDNSTATHLYRIAQEAVNNAVRHSHADQIVISLRQEKNDITLEIRDNGIGIPSNESASSNSSREAGFGLRIMKYRADLIGGALRVSKRIEGGTVVKCVFTAGAQNA